MVVPSGSLYSLITGAASAVGASPTLLASISIVSAGFSSSGACMSQASLLSLAPAACS